MDICGFLVLFRKLSYGNKLCSDSLFMQARESRKKVLAEMSEETKKAYENMRFYKFYPVETPDTPDISKVKVRVWKLLHNVLQGVTVVIGSVFE